MLEIIRVVPSTSLSQAEGNLLRIGEVTLKLILPGAGGEIVVPLQNGLNRVLQFVNQRKGARQTEDCNHPYHPAARQDAGRRLGAGIRSGRKPPHAG
jgi:hypothetical protein